jgi:glycosyltransferase involved in cell wall biosynthesis
LLAYQRRALFVADVVHATAESEKWNIENISRYCPLLSDWHPKIHVIGNGVDTRGIVVKTSWKRNHKLLFLSRVHPKKGIDLLLQAFCELRTLDGPLCDYVLQIVGEGDNAYLSSLRSLADSLGVGEHVQWLGGVYDERKWELIREADLLLLPTYSENFGIVVAEALASGTPVLTTKGTPWNVLNTECCGWCMDVNVEAIKSALCSFANASEDELQHMGLLGRTLVEENYDTRSIARKYVELYASICK